MKHVSLFILAGLLGASAASAQSTSFGIKSPLNFSGSSQTCGVPGLIGAPQRQGKFVPIGLPSKSTTAAKSGFVPIDLPSKTAREAAAGKQTEARVPQQPFGALLPD